MARLHRHRAGGAPGRVVLPGEGRAEDGEDPVPHELHDRSLVGQDHVRHRRQIGVQQRQHLLRVQPLGQGGEAPQVGHEKRDPAVLTPEPGSLGRGEEPAHHLLAHVPAEQALDERVPQLEVLGEAADLLLLALERQLGLDPRQDHREVEWLGHVVVRPGPQGLHHVLGGVTRGGHDDRQVGLRPPLADLPEDVEPAQPRHHHVEEDDVESPFAETVERLLPIDGGLHLKAPAAEPTREHVAVQLVVVHHQQAHRAGVEGRRRPSRLRRRREGGRGGLRLEEDRGGGVRPGGNRLVGHLEGPAGGGADLREIGESLALAPVPGLVLEELRVADDLVKGGPQVVPKPGAGVDLGVVHPGGTYQPRAATARPVTTMRPPARASP